MPQPKMPNTSMTLTKPPHPDDYFPDEKYPDEVILDFNDQGDIIIGKYALSHEVRISFMDRYEKHDCRRLAFLKDYTDTGGLFARKIVNVAGITCKGREFPNLSHPDRVCRRAIQTGWDEETGPYHHELEVIKSHVPQISAPKHEKDRKAHEYEKKHASFRHHGSHEKYEKAKHGGHGMYK